MLIVVLEVAPRLLVTEPHPWDKAQRSNFWLVLVNFEHERK